jgi:hypothetical protein
MLVLAREYLLAREKMREQDIGRLETLVADSKRSTLHHLISMGMGISQTGTSYIEGINEAVESLV